MDGDLEAGGGAVGSAGSLDGYAGTAEHGRGYQGCSEVEARRVVLVGDLSADSSRRVGCDLDAEASMVLLLVDDDVASACYFARGAQWAVGGHAGLA